MIKQPALLDVTLATDFLPGTNIKGEIAGANWVFLLPSLALEQVLCLGAPRQSTLLMLSNVSKRVVVVDSNTEQSDLENVVWHPITDLVQPESVIERFDLIVIAAQKYVQQFKRSRALQSALTQLSGPQTLFYWEEFPGFQRNAYLKLSTEKPRYYWLTPLNGDAMTAVPLEDRQTTNYFLNEGLFSPSVQKKMFKPVKKKLMGGSSSIVPVNGTQSKPSSGKLLKRTLKRGLRQVARVAGVTMLSQFEMAERALNQHTTLLTRRGVLASVSRDAASFLQGPPQYLCELAYENGIDITHHRWGIVASGDYSSRKVLCFLFSEHESKPEYIVKMVRHPRFNARLENEVRALTLLRQMDQIDLDTIPQIAFAGHHAQLAMVGETHLGGTPFRQRTTYREDCLYGNEAINWIAQLGEASAASASIDAREVGESLQYLLSRFQTIYPLLPDESAFLEQQLQHFYDAEYAIPAVFQHGDPGTWNMLVQDNGKLAVLDWEAAEPTGLPLWDLFYFLRSFAAGAARKEGITDRIQGFRKHFLGDTGINRLVNEATWHYAERIGLAPQFVQPLFYSCWMHRALKEATRLTPKKIAKGHYFNILRLCIQQHDHTAFQRLFHL